MFPALLVALLLLFAATPATAPPVFGSIASPVTVSPAGPTSVPAGVPPVGFVAAPVTVPRVFRFVAAPVEVPPGFGLVSAPVPVDVPPIFGLVAAAALPVFGWPVDSGRVTRRFDPPPAPWLPGHRGVDLAAPPSAVVRAAGPGVVVFAGRVAGRGVVSVAHPGGLRTTYEPLTPSVAIDDRVTTGAEIGRLTSGHPGCPEAACLHWGLRRGDLYLDPLALLGLGRVRLLPLGEGP